MLEGIRCSALHAVTGERAPVVFSIDPTLEAIEGAGGKTLVPKQSIGEHGFIAHFEDTEGNRVAVHESPA